MNGKGSHSRVTDHKAFRDRYGDIDWSSATMLLRQWKKATLHRTHFKLKRDDLPLRWNSKT